MSSLGAGLSIHTISTGGSCQNEPGKLQRRLSRCDNAEHRFRTQDQHRQSNQTPRELQRGWFEDVKVCGSEVTIRLDQVFGAMLRNSHELVGEGLLCAVKNMLSKTAGRQGSEFRNILVSLMSEEGLHLLGSS